MRNTLAGRRGPLIFLSDLVAASRHVEGDTYDFTIDFTQVPIRYLSAATSLPSARQRRDFTGSLNDGQLNVLVTGQSKVDFSELSIQLEDPR